MKGVGLDALLGVIRITLTLVIPVFVVVGIADIVFNI